MMVIETKKEIKLMSSTGVKKTIPANRTLAATPKDFDERSVWVEYKGIKAVLFLDEYNLIQPFTFPPGNA